MLNNMLLEKLTEIEYDLSVLDNPELIQETKDKVNENLFKEKTDKETELIEYQNIKEILDEANNKFNKTFKEIKAEYNERKNDNLVVKEKLAEQFESDKLAINKKYKKKLDTAYPKNITKFKGELGTAETTYENTLNNYELDLKSAEKNYKRESQELQNTYNNDIDNIKNKFEEIVSENNKVLLEKIKSLEENFNIKYKDIKSNNTYTYSDDLSMLTKDLFSKMKLLLGNLYKTKLHDIYLKELSKVQDELTGIEQNYSTTLDSYNKTFIINKKTSEGNYKDIEYDYNSKYNVTQHDFEKKMNNYNEYLLYKLQVLKARAEVENELVEAKKSELEENLKIESETEKLKIENEIEEEKIQKELKFNQNKKNNLDSKNKELDELEVVYIEDFLELVKQIKNTQAKLYSLDEKLNQEKLRSKYIYNELEDKIKENQEYFNYNINKDEIIKSVLKFKETFFNPRGRLNNKNEYIEYFNKEIKNIIAENKNHIDDKAKLYHTNKQNKFLLGFEEKEFYTENFKIDNKNEHIIHKPIYIDDLNIDKNEAILFIYDDINNGKIIAETDDILNKSYYSMLEYIIISSMFKVSNINYQLKIIDPMSIVDEENKENFSKQNLKILNEINTEQNEIFNIINAEAISNLNKIQVGVINEVFEDEVFKGKGGWAFEDLVLDNKFSIYAFKRIILSIRMYYNNNNNTITLKDLDRFFKLILSKGILPIILISKTNFYENYLNKDDEQEKSNIKNAITTYCNGNIYFIENINKEEDIIKVNKIKIDDYK